MFEEEDEEEEGKLVFGMASEVNQCIYMHSSTAVKIRFCRIAVWFGVGTLAET